MTAPALEKLLIDRETPVRDALRLLEETGNKTLFVICKKRRLIGTLSDGDVRRWILSGRQLDVSADALCNRAPFSVRADYRVADVRAAMRDRGIMCVPVIAADGSVRDLVHLDDIIDATAEPAPAAALNLPVVIMAGGKGTRMAPFTSVLPKPLIPLGDKTVIEMIVDSFTAYGIDDFYLSVNYKSKIMKSYFDELDPPYSVRYIYENKPLGTAGSLHNLAGTVEQDILVTNCDVLINVDLRALVEHHRKRNNLITLVVSLKNFSIPYGICEVENGGCLKEIREKPEYNFLVNTGLYVLKPEALDMIPQDEFFHITDLIEKARGSGARVGVYPISDNAWMDTGEWAEYRNAVAKLTSDRRRQQP